MKTKISTILAILATSVFAFAADAKVETPAAAPQAKQDVTSAAIVRTPEEIAKKKAEWKKVRAEQGKKMRETIVLRSLLTTKDDLGKLAARVAEIQKMTPEQKAEAIKALPKPAFRGKPAGDKAAQPKVDIEKVKASFVERFLLSVPAEELNTIGGMISAVQQMTPEQKAEALKALPKPEFRKGPKGKGPKARPAAPQEKKIVRPNVRGKGKGDVRLQKIKFGNENKAPKAVRGPKGGKAPQFVRGNCGPQKGHPVMARKGWNKGPKMGFCPKGGKAPQFVRGNCGPQKGHPVMARKGWNKGPKMGFCPKGGKAPQFVRGNCGPQKGHPVMARKGWNKGPKMGCCPKCGKAPQFVRGNRGPQKGHPMMKRNHRWSKGPKCCPHQAPFAK